MTTAMQFKIEILHSDQWSDDANLLGHGCSDADNAWATEAEALASCDELAAIGGFDRSHLRVVPAGSHA